MLKFCNKLSNKLQKMIINTKTIIASAIIASTVIGCGEDKFPNKDSEVVKSDKAALASDNPKVDKHLKEVGGCYATISWRLKNRKNEPLSKDELDFLEKNQATIDKAADILEKSCGGKTGQQYENCVHGLPSGDVAVIVGMSEAYNLLISPDRPEMLSNSTIALMAYCTNLITKVSK